jgi:hypothetical protein
LQSGCGAIHITVNFKDGVPVEVYAKSSSSGGCTANTELIGRLISKALQHGVPVEVVIDQCCTVRCPNAMANKEKTRYVIVGFNDDKPICIKSCGDAIGKAIKMAMQIEEGK